MATIIQPVAVAEADRRTDAVEAPLPDQSLRLVPAADQQARWAVLPLTVDEVRTGGYVSNEYLLLSWWRRLLP